MGNLLLVAAGGAIGAMARYGSVQIAARYAAFPIGTMLVNIVGSLLIGILIAKLQSDSSKLLLVTGVLGGFTTFSAFSWDALQLFQKNPMHAAIYILGSVVLSLIAVWIGFSVFKG